MPAHMGVKGRFAAFRAFVYLNTAQTDDARTYRNRLRTEQAIQRAQGQAHGRAGTGFASFGDAAQMIRARQKRMRETEFTNYQSFRSALDFYDPRSAAQGWRWNCRPRD